jgi:hypothetical protein
VDNLTAALQLSSASFFSIVKYHLHLASELGILFLIAGVSTSPGPVMPLRGRTVMSAASIMSALAILLIASPALPNSLKAVSPRYKIDPAETSCSHAASVSAHSSCSWIAHGGYMVRDCSSEKADARGGKPSEGLAILMSNDAGKPCEHSGICKDLKTPEARAVVVEGNDWQYNYRKN